MYVSPKTKNNYYKTKDDFESIKLSKKKKNVYEWNKILLNFENKTEGCLLIPQCTTLIKPFGYTAIDVSTENYNFN